MRRLRSIPLPRPLRILIDESGAALVVALLVALFVVVIGTAYMALGGYEVLLVGNDNDVAQAFWLAEAGRHHAHMVLNRDYSSFAPTTDIAHFAQGSPSQGAYDVTLDLLPGGTSLRLISSGTTPKGTVRSVVTVYEIESFAKYAYFSEAEQAPGGLEIWFYTGDRLEGPVHSNGQIHIAGNPRFDDLLTSHWPTFRYWNNGNPINSTQGSTATDHPVFGGTPAPGYQLDVATIPIPFTTADIRQAAQTGGLALTGNYQVIVSRNNAYGTVSYRPNSTGAWTSVAMPANGILHVQGNMNLQGVVDGSLTVGASGNVTLTDDLVYRDSDASGIPIAGCTDYMGVVAAGNVIIAQNTPNQTDIRINAVVMAMNTSFTVQNYDQGSFRGTLTLWGGIIQRYRGPVGTFGGSGGRTGYQKNYHYDGRMQTRTPPGFPLSYRRTSWSPV